MTTLCFLWHMHQPFYKDLWKGQYKLPWTRLHALKDYAGMVRILEEFPSIHQTFNLVPSMVVQIEDYATGSASDPFFDCAAIPAEDLSEAQRTFVLRYFFQANLDHMISRYPRYRELYDRAQRHELFSIPDLRDLQVLSQLVWFDEDQLARDQTLRHLAIKGREYTREDQFFLTAKQRAALADVLPTYREFAAREQIEISTTPFYHPILPLLCDSDIAAVSHPGVTLPSRFEYPQDARVQLERARAYMKEKLGVAPAGLWPSEGSVSDDALALASDCGFRWAASDNGVLSRTLGEIAGCELTYQPYIWRDPLREPRPVRAGIPVSPAPREIQMIFRDRYLSDLIGFEYARMSASDAAGHFIHKIHENTQGRHYLVPIILDGENAWEWYEGQGRPFLRELYRRIEEDTNLEALTVSEALRKFEPRLIDHIHPGSWINSNFDIWIGSHDDNKNDEDNRAWEFLLAARRTYDAHSQLVSEEARALAYEELLIAEGSDWCWWYGPEHGSDNRPDFDQLYRDHLANVYRALNLVPPAALSHPILESQPGEFHEKPTHPLSVTLDGKETTVFEWMGAGRYRPDPRSGAMHGGTPLAREIFYGTSGPHLLVRVDGASDATFGIEFESGPAPAKIVTGHIVEIETPQLGPRFRLTVSRDGLPPATLPPDGWIDLT